MKKLALALSLLITTQTTFAQTLNAGSEGGGGGDATEMRVNEIRSDILSWINKGGSKDLQFQNGTTLKEYNSKMKNILKEGAVPVEFTMDKIFVEGIEKTCKGYFRERVEFDPQIKCNIERFGSTNDSDQYRLVHHEYAGLVNLEKNEGSKSDYYLSDQITEYLEETIVLKLAIKQLEKEKKIDYSCKKDYENDIKKYSNKSGKQVLAGIGVGIAVGALAFTGFGAVIGLATGWGIGFVSIMSAGITGGSVASYYENLSPETRLKNAVKTIERAFYSKEELNRTYYNNLIDKILRDRNYKEFPKVYTREDIEKEIPFESVNVKTILDYQLKSVNKYRMRKDLDPITYEQYRTKILDLSKTSAFCPVKEVGKKGELVFKALTNGQLKRLLKKEQY